MASSCGTPSCANDALILAKGSKIGEPFGETMKVIADFLDYPEVGKDVRQSVEWTTSVLRDPVSRERAKSTFDTLVNPVEIDSFFDHTRDSFWTGVSDR